MSGTEYDIAWRSYRVSLLKECEIMPTLIVLPLIVAIVLIVLGRVKHGERWGSWVALTGYVLLAITAVSALLVRAGTCATRLPNEATGGTNADRRTHPTGASNVGHVAP